MDYTTHWEGRALGSEAENQKFRDLLKQAYEADMEQCFLCGKFTNHAPDCELAEALR